MSLPYILVTWLGRVFYRHTHTRTFMCWLLYWFITQLWVIFRLAASLHVCVCVCVNVGVCVCVCKRHRWTPGDCSPCTVVAPGDVAHMWRAESHMAALWLSATGHQLLLLGFTTAAHTFSCLASSRLPLQHAVRSQACVPTADVSTQWELLNSISQLALRQNLSVTLLCAHMHESAHGSPHMHFPLFVQDNLWHMVALKTFGETSVEFKTLLV